MSEYRIAAVGEVLWDVFPSGPRFGGAPANFACSAAGLGGDRVAVSMFSGVGNDDLGEAAIRALENHQVDTSGIMKLDFVTGQVLVELDDGGSASYEFLANTAWDNLPWLDEWTPHAASVDVVCFGTLGQRSERSRATIQRFVSETSNQALRVFDINLRPPYYSDEVILESLRLANVLKLNDDELPLLATLCQLSGDPLTVMRGLADRFSFHAVALTRGPDGAIILRGEESDSRAGRSVEVVDTVGAGDAFTAALALGLLENWALADINQHACEVAAFVCSQQGATPKLPTRFQIV